MTPRDYIVENGDEHFARNPVGFGPYTFVSFTPDQEMVSVRWDDWFFPNPADEGPHDKYGNWAKTVTARYFPEESARIAALEAGEIDVADRLSPDGAALFADSDDHHVITVSGLRVMGLELPINQSLDPITGGPNPWRDKRVREAANYALDREAIIDNLLTGNELPAVSPFPAGYDLPLGPSGLPGLRPGQGARLARGGGPGRLPDPVAHRDRHLGRRALHAGHPADAERRGLRCARWTTWTSAARCRRFATTWCPTPS